MPEDETKIPTGEEPGAAPAKTFTQEEVDALIGKRLAKATKGMPSEEELSKFRAWQENQQTEAERLNAVTGERDAARSELAAASAAALRAELENRALLMASELGVELTTMPYVLKMADLSAAAPDGKVDEAKLREALGKVLEDIPQLKAKREATGGTGFRVGAAPSGNAGGVGIEGKQPSMKDAIAARLASQMNK